MISTFTFPQPGKGTSLPLATIANPPVIITHTLLASMTDFYKFIHLATHAHYLAPDLDTSALHTCLCLQRERGREEEVMAVEGYHEEAQHPVCMAQGGRLGGHFSAQT